MKIFLSVCLLAVVMFNCFGHAGQGEPNVVKKVQKSPVGRHEPRG